MATEQKSYTSIPMASTTTTTMTSSQPFTHVQEPSMGAAPMQPQAIGGEQAYKYDVLKQSMPGVSIFLQPIAAPSALGFASFFAACWATSTWYCDWYGSNLTPLYIAPFVLMMGLAEICAAIWCYPARDTTGTVFHGTWGALWTAWGVVGVMAAQKLLAASPLNLVEKWGGQSEFAMWLVTVAAITGCLCLVTVHRDILIGSVACLQFIGTVLLFGGMFNDIGEDSSRRTMKAGAYFWMVASIVALTRSAVYCLPQIRQDEYTDMITSKVYRGQARVAVPIGEPGIKKGC